MVASKTKKGSRKVGRNKITCEAYRREDRQEKNAVLRQERHERRLAKLKERSVAKATD